MKKDSWVLTTLFFKFNAENTFASIIMILPDVRILYYTTILYFQQKYILQQSKLLGKIAMAGFGHQWHGK